jgi:23S rRNA (uracil1939-C5)-methyltransferase
MIMPVPGEEIELVVEKPAAGGRMIARYDGQIVLVGGAVPGERVLARIERAERRLAFASVVDVLEPSPDRRPAFADSLCGGCVYSHIAYPRQLDLKAQVLKDAFLRIGRLPLAAPVPIVASPESGYRMRARLHVKRGRIGFYREGTHVLCDAALTRQLSDAALSFVDSAIADLQRSGQHATSVELTENIAGNQRAASIEIEGQAKRVLSGEPSVWDPLRVVTNGRVSGGELHRHPESFFQANRFLVPELVGAVLDSVPSAGDVLDLYAGVGLFSVALAASGRQGMTAVEGDRSSGKDLVRNASPFGGAVTVVRESVETHVHSARKTAPVVIVDPPRTGMSSEALNALVRLAPLRLVYVSCDPATLARDARRLFDAGYTMESLRAFDLFPNTPHVESMAVFGL